LSINHLSGYFSQIVVLNKQTSHLQHTRNTLSRFTTRGGFQFSKDRLAITWLCWCRFTSAGQRSRHTCCRLV